MKKIVRNVKEKRDVYAGYPWSGPDEYVELVRKYNLFGSDLKQFLEKELKRKEIPLPKLKIG